MILKKRIKVSSSIEINVHHRPGKEDTIICFHGFGETASIFDDLAIQNPDYQYISVDLPFHGSTNFPDSHLTKKLWHKIMLAIVNTFELKHFHLVSYSLGGRFLIRTVMDFPQAIQSCTVIASDGFHYTFWYNLATFPIGGNQFFKFQMNNPSLFFKLCNLLDRYKLINPSMTKFARLQLRDAEQRNKVYRSWTYLKPMKSTITGFSHVLDERNIPVYLYIGQKDYVIREEFFDKLMDFHPTTKKYILPARHHEMVPQWLNILKDSGSFPE